MAAIAEALKPRSVLIATDFSEASEKALRYSLALARFYGSRFCLAHVVSSLGVTMAGPGAIAACEEAVSREAAELEDSLIRSGALNGIQYKFIVRQGELWPELRAMIREESTDLLVVGTHGRHGVGKLFFGSVAEQIFRQAGCPVLVFGPHSQQLPWVWISLESPNISVCDRLRTRISPRLAASHCGCQSVWSQARVSEYHSSRTIGPPRKL